MATAIMKKYALNAKGILHIDNEATGIENTETGELIYLSTLLEDFQDKMVKISVTYDEDYFSEDAE